MSAAARIAVGVCVYAGRLCAACYCLLTALTALLVCALAVCACVCVCGFTMNLYFIKISSASFNEWLFPLCAVELLKFFGLLHSYTVSPGALATPCWTSYMASFLKKKTKEQQSKWERSLLQHLHMNSNSCSSFLWVLWFSFVPSIFGGPRKALGYIEAQRLTENREHITHLHSHTSGAGCGCGCGCGFGCISWLAFELWLSSAVTWLMRVAAINICYVCIARKTFARRDLPTAWKTLPLDLTLRYILHPSPPHVRHLYASATNVLQIDSTCISN